MANQLIHQSSLYLQQHAHNPVNWYAWGDEALLKAKTENKPLLISIGYSSCHWCHVMEQESFENEAIAAAMNEGFVCIKVDREERPDIDHRYMNAIMLLHGQGGWPLNCFALPDGTPFWGGTYFRPDVWLKLLKDIAELWEQDPEQILKLSRDLTENVRNDRFRQFSDDLLRSNNSIIITTACEQMKNHFDLRNGGMNGSPKFPMPVVWNFLLTSDDPEINSHVNFTLKTLCKGGIYDHIGGGFARYCVDREWKVPHFEKMLYDNALLVSLIANACKKSADPLLLDTACHTVDFFTREMLSAQGLFYASVDADSEGEEGRFYLWKRNDWNEALGPYANLVGEYYGVDAQALWQKGDNILLRPHDDALFAQQHFLSLEELTALIRRSQNTLLNYRNKRIHPATDQKVITSWNAMFITSLCDLYESSGIDSYLKTALTAIKNLLQHLYPDEQQLFRIFDGTKATMPAFADDYAFLIKSLFRIYQCTAEENYLRIASELTEKVIEQNFDKDTGFFVFSRASLKNEPAYFELSDGVIPSSNAILAEMLFVLGIFCDKPDWKTKAENMISFMAGKVAGSPYGYTHWAFLLKMLETDLITIAITGADSENWYKQITKKYLPYTIVAFSQNGSELPYFVNRFSKEKIQAFICKGNTCQAPIDSLEKLNEALA